MTFGDDFFGAPTTPAPSGPAPMSPFGTAAAAAPVRHSAPTPGQMVHRSDNARQLLMLAGTVAVLVLGTVGFLAARSQGQKTATSVVHSVDKGLVDAHEAEKTADLRNASQLEEGYLSEHSTYASTTAQLAAAGFVASTTSRVTVVSGTATTFCLRADDTSGRAPAPLYLSSGSDVSSTPCS